MGSTQAEDVELTAEELEEHKEHCVSRPTAWELVEVNGPVRKSACKKHGVPESLDLSEMERMDNPAWNTR